MNKNRCEKIFDFAFMEVPMEYWPNLSEYAEQLYFDLLIYGVVTDEEDVTDDVLSAAAKLEEIAAELAAADED